MQSEADKSNISQAKYPEKQFYFHQRLRAIFCSQIFPPAGSRAACFLAADARVQGVSATLKKQQPCPPESGKLIKLNTLKDLPLCLLCKDIVGKEESGLSPGARLKHSLTGAV